MVSLMTLASFSHQLYGGADVPFKICSIQWDHVRVETGSGHLGQTGHVLCGSTGSDRDYESDPDSALTALLEYFNLLAHALKVYSCYLSSYHLATSFYIEIT